MEVSHHNQFNNFSLTFCSSTGLLHLYNAPQCRYAPPRCQCHARPLQGTTNTTGPTWCVPSRIILGSSNSYIRPLLRRSGAFCHHPNHLPSTSAVPRHTWYDNQPVDCYPPSTRWPSSMFISGTNHLCTGAAMTPATYPRGNDRPQPTTIEHMLPPQHLVDEDPSKQTLPVTWLYPPSIYGSNTTNRNKPVIEVSDTCPSTQ